MLINKLKPLFFFILLFSTISVSVSAQTASPTPETKTPRRRVSGVKIEKAQSETKAAPVEPEKRQPQTAQAPENNTAAKAEPTTEDRDEAKEVEARRRAENERIEREKRQRDEKDEKEKAEKERADRIAAGEAALQMQMERAASQARAQAETKAKAEADKRESEMKAAAEKRESELKTQIESDRLRREEERRASEKAASQAKERAEKEAKERIEAGKRAENERIAREAAEVKRAEAEALTKKIAAEELATKQKMRQALIEQTAIRLKFLDPSQAFKYVPATAFSMTEIETSIQNAVAANQRLVKNLSFCDPEYIGELYTSDLPSNITFASLLNNLRYFFKVNFLPDAEIGELPVSVGVTDVPWNIVLRSQLQYLDLEARCTDSNTIAILKRSKMQTLQDAQRKSETLPTELIKLRYLQPTSGGTTDVAGRSSGGSNTFETLESTINKILRADGDSRASIARIPGKAAFFIKASKEQMAEIKRVIAEADTPSFQVIVYGLIYTANENKLRDVGGQVSVVGSTPNLNVLGGLSNLGGGAPTSSGGDTPNGSTSSQPGSLVPGGVRSFGQGFGTPGQNNSIAGFSAILGNVQFSAQLSLLAQSGVVKIENRPMIFVEDGQTGLLKIGRQIAVPIQQTGLGGTGNGSLQILNAANTLQVTPQVITDLNGTPIGVKLNTQIESNEVDTSVISQGIPSVQQRSAQSNFQINLGETVVLGDFTTDAETNSETKTPGFGDLPVFGGLFKRKVKSMNKDRLFFAIRVEVIPVGTTVNTVPLKLDTQPRIPENDFFKPNNTPNVPVTVTPNLVKPNTDMSLKP